MNIVFWAIVLVAAFLIWLLASNLFYQIGDDVDKIVKHIEEEINRKDDEGDFK